MKKSHLLNLLAGVIIIGIMVLHIFEGGKISLSLFLIGLYIVSYILERKNVNIAYWATLTSVLLIFSLWSVAGRIFFAP